MRRNQDKPPVERPQRLGCPSSTGSFDDRQVTPVGRKFARSRGVGNASSSCSLAVDEWPPSPVAREVLPFSTNCRRRVVTAAVPREAIEAVLASIVRLTGGLLEAMEVLSQIGAIRLLGESRRSGRGSPRSDGPAVRPGGPSLRHRAPADCGDRARDTASGRVRSPPSGAAARRRAVFAAPAAPASRDAPAPRNPRGPPRRGRPVRAARVRYPRTPMPSRPTGGGLPRESPSSAGRCFRAARASASRFVRIAQSSRARQTARSSGRRRRQASSHRRRLIVGAGPDRQVRPPQPDPVVVGSQPADLVEVVTDRRPPAGHSSAAPCAAAPG